MKIKSFPALVHKEGLAAIMAAAALLLLSSIADAPLQGPADPAASASPHIKAPWIFVGIQFMLKFIPPLVAGVLIPLGLLMVWAGLPFLRASQRQKRWAFFSTLLAAVACAFLGYFW